MALAYVQVNIWNSKRPEKYKRGSGHDHYIAYGDYYLLNTNRMVDIVETDSGTKFKYSQAPNDHRVSPDYIETNTALSYLEIMHNGTPTDKFATLSVFPTLDSKAALTDTPVSTQIAWEDICLAYQTDLDITIGIAHLVYYDKSWKRKMVIIDIPTLMDLWALQGIAP